MTRGAHEAATAVRHHVDRQANHAQAVVQLGTVTAIDPLEVELSESDVTLTPSELLLTQWVRRYHAVEGISPGDTVTLIRKHLSGEIHWIVTDILSDGDPILDDDSGGGGTTVPPPGDWIALGSYLNPRWATPVNTSVTDLTDDFCPRFYLDRDRVYLGGVVQLDTSIPSVQPAYVIFRDLLAPYVPASQQDFRVFEDINWSSGSGSWSDSAFIWSFGSPRKAGFYLTTFSPPTGIAVALDGISYRVS